MPYVPPHKKREDGLAVKEPAPLSNNPFDFLDTLETALETVPEEPSPPHDVPKKQLTWDDLPDFSTMRWADMTEEDEAPSHVDHADHVDHVDHVEHQKPKPAAEGGGEWRTNKRPSRRRPGRKNTRR